MSNLMLHAGGRVASLDEVRNCPAPASVGRWHPTPHATVLDAVKETLLGAGYSVRAEKFALARSDARFFGVLDLETPLVQGVSLSVGVRNSTDKSYVQTDVMWSLDKYSLPARVFLLFRRA